MPGRGRPRGPPKIVTTISLPTKYAQLVQSLNLSNFVATALEEKMVDIESGPAARFVREARRFGISDAQISMLVRKSSDPAAPDALAA